MAKQKLKCPHCKIRSTTGAEDYCSVYLNWMKEADTAPIILTMPRWAWETFEIILETLSESEQTDPSISREIKHALGSVNEIKTKTQSGENS